MGVHAEIDDLNAAEMDDHCIVNFHVGDKGNRYFTHH